MPESDVSTSRLRYSAPKGPVDSFLAAPSGTAPAGGWPAVLLIHEVFGLVDHIEDLARRFAAEGYLTLAPDLYCRDQARKTISVADIERALLLSRASDVESAIRHLPFDQQDGVTRALAWRENRDADSQVPDLLAAISYLRDRPDVRGESIGAIGYCMGGGLVGKLAVGGADLAAGVINYGGIPPLDQVVNVRFPLQGHYGGTDAPITSHVPDLQEAMREHGKDFTAFIYDGAPHAFSNDTRPSYTADAATLAWQRTLEFFETHLQGALVPSR